MSYSEFMNKYIRYYEWELLQDNLKIDEIFQSSYIPANTKEIEVYRNELYNIKVVLTVIKDVKNGRETFGDKLGKKFTIEASRLHGIEEIELSTRCEIT